MLHHLHSNFSQECMFLDLDLCSGPDGRDVIGRIGAIYQNQKVFIDVTKTVKPEQLAAFNSFIAKSKYILGHDIIRKKSLLPRLRRRVSGIKITTKSVIDTLFLNPLAFPKSPYSPNVRNDCLVTNRFKDQVDNAVLAGKLFDQQWVNLLKGNGTLSFNAYRSLLHKDVQLRSTADAFGLLGAQLLNDEDLYRSVFALAAPYVCTLQLEMLVANLQKGVFASPSMAYILVWLTVSGGNSIIPSWLFRFFPEMLTFLEILRERHCSEEACQFCKKNSPQKYLTNYFGHSDFRPVPASLKTRKSLQGEIVEAAVSGKTIFAILPTGGGKSLCFQLPALMAYKRLNQLTVVISPLQALMIDQVSNLSEQIGADISASLHGMLTMPERGMVLEGVRSGAVGILYISPEQLRNLTLQKVLAERQIKAWVFDEAHCLSKWGHDFRPDYIYSIRFIREFAMETRSPIPPIQCFTATAKKSVTREIITLIEEVLAPKKVVIFAGGHKRDNLLFSAFHVRESAKTQKIVDFLEARKGQKGSCIIYCSTQDKVEELTKQITDEDYVAVAYHAGLPGPKKKQLQQDFISGKVPIICSTNAFGMGIDKDDVRLVINVGTPPSLENYNQEAGRAGRDRENADCILIFSDEDLEQQFSMSSMNNLTEYDISNILRLIHKAYVTQENGTVVVSPVELLRLDSDSLDTKRLPDAITKVYTAISWLERAGCIQRNENKTQVLQVKPLVSGTDDFFQKVHQLNIPSFQERRWLVVIQELLAKGRTSGITVDDLAKYSEFSPEVQSESKDVPTTARVVEALIDMTKHGLLAHSTNMVASFSSWIAVNTEKGLNVLIVHENAFLKIIKGFNNDDFLTVDLRQISHQMQELGYIESTPSCLRMILQGLCSDGKGFEGKTGSLSMESIGNNHFILHMHRSWEEILHLVKIRQRAAFLTFELIRKIVLKSVEDKKQNLQARFTLEEVDEILRRDKILKPLLRNSLFAAERALTYLNQQKRITLENGLAIFHQSMILEWPSDGKFREYTADDYKPLADFYQEKYFMIHAMNEFAIRASKSSDDALELMSSYFNDSKVDFVSKYFAGREKYLQWATSRSFHSRIVEDLENKTQETIVTAGVDENMLVLSGPGAGKTKVLVHRIAFLLKACRVKGKNIIVLTFTRSAALDIRKKLTNLVEKDMYGVQVYTFHGFALRLLGKSILNAGEKTENGKINVKEYINKINALLKMKADEATGYGGRTPRDVLVGGASHIFVDEYQDIDAEQYELVELLAGRHLPEKVKSVSIMAVGDDAYTFISSEEQVLSLYVDSNMIIMLRSIIWSKITVLQTILSQRRINSFP